MADFDPAAFTIREFVYPVVIAGAIAALPGLINALTANDGKSIKAFFRAYSLYFLSGLPVALAGYSTGFLTGLSRAPAVGNLLPAVLALIGGLSVYVFGAESKSRLLVGYCVCLLVLNVFYGVQAGAFERDSGRLARLLRLSEQELMIRNYRKARGLEPEIPSWILTGENK